MVERDSPFAELMIEIRSDKVRDADAKESILRNFLPAVSILFLCGGSCCATNAARIKSKWIAICDSANVFATDIVGIETIAEGSS